MADEFQESIPPEIMEKFRKGEDRLKGDSLSLAEKGHYLMKIGRYSEGYSEPLFVIYTKKAIAIFEEEGLDSLRAEALANLSIPYINNTEFIKAREVLTDACEYWQSVDNQARLAHALIMFGFLERRALNYQKALEHFLNAKRIQEATGSRKDMGNVYNRLMILYYRLGDYDTALSYYNEYLSSFDLPADEDIIFSPVFLNAYNSYTKLEEYEDALACLNRVKGRYMKSKSPKRKSEIYDYFYFASYNKKDYQKARIYIDSALYFRRQFDNKRDLAKVLMNKYSLLSEMNRPREGYPSLQEAERLTTGIGDNRLFKELYENLADFSTHVKDYKLANNYLLKADSLKDLIFTEDLNDEVVELEKRMIREQSEQEIALLNEQNILKTANIEKDKKLRYFLIGLLTLFGFLGGLSFLFFRQRSQQNVVLREKNAIISKALEDNKFLVKEVHHRVKNNLQVVASLLNLQSRYVEDDSALYAIKTSKTRVQSMSLLHQSLYSNDNLKSINVQNYFEDLGQNLFETYHVDAKDLRFYSEIEDLELDVDTVVPLGLITNELITNALKHAFTDLEEGEIRLKLHQDHGHLTLEVRDNGQGIEFTELPEKTTSLGLQLIKSFAAKLNARVEIYNQGGTIFRLNIPNETVNNLVI